MTLNKICSKAYILNKTSSCFPCCDKTAHKLRWVSLILLELYLSSMSNAY